MLKICKFNDEIIENMDSKICDLEKKYNISLPMNYKNFLKKYNGGMSPKTSFKMNGEASDIRAFYGFKEKDINFSFRFLEDGNFLSRYIEIGYFPIATDSFGNDIVIGVTNENWENIFFFDSELGKYKLLSENIVDFFKKVRSTKFYVRTIEERIQGMKESNSPIVVDDELLNYWKEEINRLGGLVQEAVKLDTSKEHER